MYMYMFMYMICVNDIDHQDQFKRINQLVGLREKLPENPIEIIGNSGWFPVKIFPFLSTNDFKTSMD